MTLNYFRRADKSPVQFSISCLVRRLQSKMVKNHHGQMVFCGVVIMGCKGNYDDW